MSPADPVGWTVRAPDQFATAVVAHCEYAQHRWRRRDRKPVS